MLEDFFDDKTMSIHLRENNYPYAKKGTPKKWEYVKIRNKKLTKQELEDLSFHLLEVSDANLEIDKPNSKIIQKGDIRILINTPPFSDGWEITAVRPVKLLELDEYNISKKLLERINKQAEGILVAGSPGQGKTTFARALALYYANDDKIVKTMEAPRDLILPENITQYSLAHGSDEQLRDILLLSRPDFTIFDEMRNTNNFQLFADLRLSGVGMVGIVHATTAIDAIQRFIGRIELGVIPQIIDTVIFIKKGIIEKVFELSITVKVPFGMHDSDLARPVVTVSDFETGQLDFEIYSYGEDKVVIPIEKIKPTQEILQNVFKKYKNVKIDISGNNYNIYLPDKDMLILKNEISNLEEKFGIKFNIKKIAQDYSIMKFTIESNKRYITLIPKENIIGKEVEIFINDKFLMSAKVGKKNTIKVNKESEPGKYIYYAINSEDKLELRK